MVKFGGKATGVSNPKKLLHRTERCLIEVYKLWKEGLEVQQSAMASAVLATLGYRQRQPQQAAVRAGSLMPGKISICIMGSVIGQLTTTGSWARSATFRAKPEKKSATRMSGSSSKTFSRCLCTILSSSKFSKLWLTALSSCPMPLYSDRLVYSSGQMTCALTYI